VTSVRAARLWCVLAHMRLSSSILGHDGPRQAMVMNGVEAVDMIGVEVAEDDHRHLGNIEVIQTILSSLVSEAGGANGCAAGRQGCRG
jgi:hypothetical protein